MFTKAFWLETLERAVRAFAVALLGTTQAIDWALKGEGLGLREKLIGAGIQALGSVLISLAGTNVGAKDSPALLPREDDPPVPGEE